MPFWKRNRRPFQADPDENNAGPEELSYSHSLRTPGEKRRGEKLPTLPRDYKSREQIDQPDMPGDPDHVLIRCPKCTSLLKVNRRYVIRGFPCPACKTQLALSAEQLFPTHKNLQSFRIADARKDAAPGEGQREGLTSTKPSRNWEAARRAFTGVEADSVSRWRKLWDQLLVSLGLREPVELVYVVAEGQIEESARKILESGAINRENLENDIGVAPASTYRYRKSIQPKDLEEAETELDSDLERSEFSAYAPSYDEDEEEDEEKIGDARFDPGQKEAFFENWEGADHVPAEEFETPREPSWLASTLASNPATRWLVKDESVQWVLLGAMVTLLGIAGLATTYALVKAREYEIPIDHDLERIQWAIDQRREFRSAAIAYVEAQDIESMLVHVRTPDEVRPLMESHYQKHRLEPADDAEVVQDNWNHIRGDEAAVVEIKSRNRVTTRLLVMATTPQGWKVDWEVSEGYERISIDELISQKPRNPVEMRFMIERSKYYNWQFTDRERYHSFKLTFPSNTGVLHGFALRDSAAGRVLDRLLSDTEVAGVVLAIHYPDDVRDERIVVIDRFIQKNWLALKEKRNAKGVPSVRGKEDEPGRGARRPQSSDD